ncbi:ATP-dependent DNA ligase [Frigoribacterium sp. 2-23]|uniref:DUF7882 family protein n=1 Tax=Frigoribacterium sp. 2-23 TaxID=3415006 RepID=UPI003C6F5307
MGTLFYGANRLAIDFDDRALAHLQLAIVTKLRRHESFAFTWRHDDASGQGRNVIWLHESIPLQFSYAGSRMANVNRQWIDALLASASTTLGMRLVDEPAVEGSQQPHAAMSVDGA